jgi:hypothetical protein
MSVPVHRRPFDAFLSHAHVDRAFVDSLYRWLGEVAGLNIWYDAKQMTGGQGIGSGLQAGIQECRGLLLVASKEAITRGWVKSELDIARVEQADSPDFRIVPLRLGDADLSSTIIGQSWIDVPQSQLTADVAMAILSAFYPGDNRPDPRNSRDVYLSGSWQPEDHDSAVAVSRSLAQAGFRLIGDAKDQKGFRGDRIQSIVESCGALVCVVPYRGVEPASAAEKPYKYFLTELDLAVKAGLPTVVVADPRVRRSDGEDQSWLRIDTCATACPQEVQSAIDGLWDRWTSPPRPHEVFLAIDLSTPGSRRDSDVRRLVERITGMKTVVGDEIREADIQSGILRAIQRAFLMIADLTSTTDDAFNLDVCIEAGMALAAETNLALVSKGKPRSPPFMLRQAGQLLTYADDVDQFGVLHNLVRDYRRRVINAELYRY